MALGTSRTGRTATVSVRRDSLMRGTSCSKNERAGQKDTPRPCPGTRPPSRRTIPARTGGDPMADLREMPEAELRGRVRKLLAEVHPERTDSIAFRRKQFEHGLALVHFPVGHGGLGISPRQQLTVLDEIQKHSKVVHHDPLVKIGRAHV